MPSRRSTFCTAFVLPGSVDQRQTLMKPVRQLELLAVIRASIGEPSAVSGKPSRYSRTTCKSWLTSVKGEIQARQILRQINDLSRNLSIDRPQA
jgi:hypothetical protein